MKIAKAHENTKIFIATFKQKNMKYVTFRPVVLKTFMSRGPLQKTKSIVTLGLCNITPKLSIQGLCSWSPGNSSVAP